ncbi:hypothetical protein FIBSPDRAFT_962038 [Athelia psychrophila]|uniref:Uncharacterized protein n=1 Tax=Athelia psychrophila TaxID=1759441 RepID=A0A166AMN8_9AGAM|nr:hypothetical protein FIBSPDRAFT_962038 [Fibularhizoctonia sp. CBS 109695]
MQLQRKLGRPTWVYGAKLRFFSVASDEWQDAKKKGPQEVGAFYTNITKKFIVCFGWHFDYKNSDQEWVEVGPETWADINDTTGLSDEEVEKRKAYFQDLRKRASPEDWHGDQDYTLQDRPDTSQAPSSDVHVPVLLTYLLFPALQANVEAYEEKMKALDVVPDDAPAFHKALANAAAFMQPLCDLTAKKFGAAVTMLVVLPVDNGAIEMRSVFSGKTSGLVPKTYPEFDPLGFDALQQSYVNFGHHVFSKADCDLRVLHAMETKDGDSDQYEDDATPAAGTASGSRNRPFDGASSLSLNNPATSLLGHHANPTPDGAFSFSLTIYCSNTG